jgi:hypothetical protein
MYIKYFEQTSSAKIGTISVEVAVLLVTSVANDAMRLMTSIISHALIS